MPSPIYVPKDTRADDLNNSLMQIIKMQQVKKQQRREDASMKLQTIMEMGGTPDALQDALQGIGYNPTQASAYANSVIDKETGQILSRDERKLMTEIKGISGKTKATAEAQAETEPITTQTEINKTERMLPVLKKVKEQDLDLMFGQKKKELELQFEMDKKKSAEITIPEFKTTHDYLLNNQKSLATQNLEDAKELEKYKRELKTVPTPEEKSKIDEDTARIVYLNGVAEYYRTVKAQMNKANLANKDFVNTLKSHTQFMKDNTSKFYDKGKGGKLTPHEYTPGSQEETDFIASMDAAGIKYQKSTASHWGIMGGNKNIFIPVAPTPPEQTAVSGAMDITSVTKASVTLANGKVVKRNADGTVTINGVDYEVEE